MIRTLSRQGTETKEFLKFIREDLRKNRVRLTFSRSRDVRFSGRLTTVGFFEEPTSRTWGRIRIGTGNRKPVTILTNLIHEYCHFLQWKNGDSEYHRSDSDWIDGERYVLLEERTEREAINLIREWNLPMNLSAVRKRSRAYIAWLRATQIDT